VIELLQRFGHDTSKLSSKSWERFCGPDTSQMDFVIALSDSAEDKAPPELGNTALTALWPLPDPNTFNGSERDRALLLNELYGSLVRRIKIFISLPFASLDRMALKARLEELGGGTAGTAQ